MYAMDASGSHGRCLNVIEDGDVLLQLVALLQEEPTGGVLRVHDIRITGSGNPRIVKGPSMPACAPTSKGRTWSVTFGSSAASAKRLS